MRLEVSFRFPKIPALDGRHSAVIREEMNAFSLQAGQAVKAGILPFVPVDEGKLRNSIRVSIAPTAYTVTAAVRSPVGYAAPMNNGSKPHWPPITAIERWVRHKFGGRDASEQRSIAFLVARKIAKRGTKAHRFMEKGSAAARTAVLTLWGRMGQRIARRLVSP